MPLPATSGAAVQDPPLYHLPGFHEPFSAISHLFGAGLFLVLGFLLLRRGWGDTARLIFLGVYAVSCVLLLSMSAVFHMVVRGGPAHRVMERLDHGAIFILIAGTFTPGHGLLFRGPLRWGSPAVQNWWFTGGDPSRLLWSRLSASSITNILGARRCPPPPLWSARRGRAAAWSSEMPPMRRPCRRPSSC